MHELPWLLPPAKDFNDRCAQLVESSSLVEDVQTLVRYSLTINHSNRLVRAIKKLSDSKRLLLEQSFTPLKLGLVSNSTMDLFVPSMVTAALRSGIYLEVVTADFGQVAQEAFDPHSELNQAGLDVVLLALDYRAYPFAANAYAKSQLERGGVDALDYLNQIRSGFATNSGAICITQSLASVPYTLGGSFDALHSGLLRKEIAEFNRALAQSIDDSADVMLDVEGMASAVGNNNWFDERQWYLSRVPIANRFVPYYADRLARLLGALRGKSKKCLVLDLDNTLWGGVIGDDGLDGIAIGQGSPLGEAHLAIQQYAAELKSLGVILAVCSKNEEEIARQAFREHPDMLLKETDFSVFYANWEDKAANIRAIAQSLNIGLDALVFVDDNPAEREIVRSLVPEVEVPELPQDVSQIPRTLSAAGYFEMISFTQDDADRHVQYAANAQRTQLLEASAGLGDYLASLEMRISFEPFNEMGRKRIIQLINKTNQFNVTTRRYTEAEVVAFEQSSDVVSLQVRLIDRFGDNGMISVVICKASEQGCWEIDSWLMSCRVIKRRVEEAVCDELVRQARANNIRLLRGYYCPTAKNKLVKEHYAALGFSKVSSGEGHDVWELEVASYLDKCPPIRIMR